MNTSAMSTAAAPKPRAIWFGSGLLTRVNVANGSDTIGPENGLRLKNVV